MIFIKAKFLFICFLLGCSLSYATDFRLKISFTEGESSRDSWSSTTTISILGNYFDYSKKYSGVAKGVDADKKGQLSDDQIQKIVELIVNDKLNITDSISDYTEKLKSNYNQYAEITIYVFLQGMPNTIKIEGDKKSLGNNPVYKGALDLIDLLKDYIDNS
jgi:hypothetical protein